MENEIKLQDGQKVEVEFNKELVNNELNAKTPEVQTNVNTDSIEELTKDATVENKDANEVTEGVGADFSMRTGKPGAGNKFYITRGAGGYSQCIVGSPTDRECNVLANCVGYACGRFNEIIGTMNYPYLNCNAENFIERAISCGLSISKVPTLGGIMVWQKGATLGYGDGAGHVAVVERLDSANQILTSESGYGSSAFWNSTRNNSNGRWGLGNGYTFRGCIINPAIGDVHYVDPTPVQPTKSIDELANEVIRGDWGNGQDRKDRLTNAGYDYNAVQNRVNEILAGNQPSVDILDLVRRTIRGDFGNGEARKNALGSNYSTVQHQVDLNYANGTTQWGNIKLY